MPWRLKRQLILIGLGVMALALAIVVWILNQDTSTDLLAVLGLLGGLAIIVNTLPANGNNHDDH